MGQIEMSPAQQDVQRGHQKAAQGRTMSDTTQTTISTAKPKGDRWQHKELEATIKNPAITRVSESGNLFGKVRRGKTGKRPCCVRVSRL